MSWNRNWGGDRTGEIIVATKPFGNRIGNCFVGTDRALLPNGVVVEGAKGEHIKDYLNVGTLAVSVQHSGDYYNTYVPVNVSPIQNGVILTPFLDFKFGAYTYGNRVGSLEALDTQRIAAGMAVQHMLPEIILKQAAAIQN